MIRHAVLLPNPSRSTIVVSTFLNTICQVDLITPRAEPASASSELLCPCLCPSYTISISSSSKSISSPLATCSSCRMVLSLSSLFAGARVPFTHLVICLTIVLKSSSPRRADKVCLNFSSAMSPSLLLDGQSGYYFLLGSVKLKRLG